MQKTAADRPMRSTGAVVKHYMKQQQRRLLHMYWQTQHIVPCLATR